MKELELHSKILAVTLTSLRVLAVTTDGVTASLLLILLQQIHHLLL